MIKKMLLAGGIFLILGLSFLIINSYPKYYSQRMNRDAKIEYNTNYIKINTDKIYKDLDSYYSNLYILYFEKTSFILIINIIHLINGGVTYEVI